MKHWLESNTSIQTYNMDARNFVDQLVNQELTGGPKTRYDFIYEDALNDYLIPFQLVTKEFNDKISVLLGENGIYLIELIDLFDSGLFVGSYVNTLKKTFNYVYVVGEARRPRSDRTTFVIAASSHELDLENLADDYQKKQLDLWLLDESDINELKKKSGGLVMTDDYVPVENHLAPVVVRRSAELLGGK